MIELVAASLKFTTRSFDACEQVGAFVVGVVRKQLAHLSAQLVKLRRQAGAFGGVRRRLRLLDQALHLLQDRVDGIGRIQRSLDFLERLAHCRLQARQVLGLVKADFRREVCGGVVDRGVHSPAGGQPLLSGSHKLRGALQRQ